VSGCVATNHKSGISTYVVGDIIYFRGERLPPAPRRSNKQTVFVGDTICINGHEWKNGKWKKTLRALWHMMF